MPNLFSLIPDSIPAELTETLITAQGVRIERIVSVGHASPPGFWYDQPQSEFVLLVQGAARLNVEHELVEIRAGDWLNIPPRRKHRVEWTAPNEKTIWLAVFYD